MMDTQNFAGSVARRLVLRSASVAAAQCTQPRAFVVNVEHLLTNARL